MNFDTMRCYLLYDVRKNLPNTVEDPPMFEEEFAECFDALAKSMKDHEKTIRPKVWAYVMHACANLMAKEKKWPQELSSTSQTTS
jgi:hypothetical protein